MNNVDSMCLALMADNRLLTDYRPQYIVSECIMKNNKLHTNRELKNYLENNGEYLLNKMHTFYKNKTACIYNNYRK